LQFSAVTFDFQGKDEMMPVFLLNFRLLSIRVSQSTALSISSTVLRQQTCVSMVTKRSKLVEMMHSIYHEFPNSVDDEVANAEALVYFLWSLNMAENMFSGFT
jgi:hypothetical protein